MSRVVLRVAAGLLAAAAFIAATSASAADLAQARAAFATAVHAPPGGEGPVPKPPAGVFDLVKFASPVGDLQAYLTPDPHDGKRHPAIIWITGGDFTSIGDMWSPAPRSNDQSAAAFRHAGIVTMFPSLRGGNDNPGKRELFYGEADDILAAADFLAKQPWVDPQRIYLGGHSTGGTMVLLTSELTTRFRATFAFGAVTDVRGYGTDLVPVDLDRLDPRETRLRRGVDWLDSVHRPLFMLEGLNRPGNIDDLHAFERANHNPLIHVMGIPGASHFSDLAPATEVIAAKILADTGASCDITLTPDEVVARMR